MRSWTIGLAILAGLFGVAGVGLAAAGPHLDGGPVVTTAANIMLFHAAALVGLSVAAAGSGSARGLLGAATILALGTILFSGEIALHILAGVTGLQKAAPIGGGLMILGWLGIAITLPITLGRSIDRLRKTSAAADLPQRGKESEDRPGASRSASRSPSDARRVRRHK